MATHRLQRRDLLKLLGGGALAATLAACAPQTAAPTQAPKAEPTKPAPTAGAAPTTPAKPTEAAAKPTAAPGQAGQKVVVRYWDFQQSDKSILDAQQKAIQEFQQANPNIEIQVEVTPYPQYRDKLLVAARGGNPPDIATLDQIWTSEFAASGSIIPLDDYIKASSVKRELFFPGAWDSNVWRGQTWGIPLNNDVWQELYFNVELFEQAGLDPTKPPATWEELTEAARKLTKAPDVYGLAV